MRFRKVVVTNVTKQLSAPSSQLSGKPMKDLAESLELTA
jgi:hypothetical protein